VDTRHTTLGELTAPATAKHPGESGFLLFNTGEGAIQARVAMAELAQSSIDAMYFQWGRDTVGRVLLDRMIAAADRGVRVPLLIDDYWASGYDLSFETIAAHPNMEVRVFNPFVRGRMRVTQLLGRFTELNRRMHNKLFVADGQLAVVGGRNLIDDYFGLGKEICYRDFDLLAMGPVVSQAEAAFDQYWNSQWAYPISSLVKPPSQAEADRELHRFSERVAADRANFPYALPHDRDTALAFLVQFRGKGIWGPAELVYDDPNSVTNPAEAPPGRVWKKVNELAMQAQHEIVIENPYLLPEPKMPTVRALRERGVQLRMLTNSLGTADEVPLNAHYAKARPEMVDLGVELYEVKPYAASRALYIARPATSKARLGAARKGHGVRPQDGGHRIVQPRSALEEPRHRNGLHRAEPTAGGAGSRRLRPRLRARERLAHRRRRRRGRRRLDHREPRAAARRAARSGQRVAALPPVNRAAPAHCLVALRNRLTCPREKC